jgi:hypothetical protein
LSFLLISTYNIYHYHLLLYYFSIVLQSLLLPSSQPATLQLASYYKYKLDLQISTKHYLSGFVFCLCSYCLLHLLCRYSYTPTYSTVLTIMHLNGTSILSFYNSKLFFFKEDFLLNTNFTIFFLLLSYIILRYSLPLYNITSKAFLLFEKWCRKKPLIVGLLLLSLSNRKYKANPYFIKKLGKKGLYYCIF